MKWILFRRLFNFYSVIVLMCQKKKKIIKTTNISIFCIHMPSYLKLWFSHIQGVPQKVFFSVFQHSQTLFCVCFECRMVLEQKVCSTTHTKINSIGKQRNKQKTSVRGKIYNFLWDTLVSISVAPLIKPKLNLYMYTDLNKPGIREKASNDVEFLFD